MLGSAPPPRHIAGKTFLIAVSLLGIAALIQVGAYTWAIVKGPEAARSRGSEVLRGTAESPAPALAAADPAESVPLTESLLASVPAPAPAPELSAPVVRPVAPQPPPTESLAPIVPPAKPVPVSPTALAQKRPPDSRYQELLTQGIALRDRGDMGNAFTRFREARSLDPTNPASIAEIAVTYEKMGLGDKASEQWKKILDMGERAGYLYVAADARLKQSQAQAILAAQGRAEAVVPVGAATNPRAVLCIGEISLTEQPDPGTEKHFTMRIAIQHKDKAPINTGDVGVHVLFYDLVDGKTLTRTNALVHHRFVSPPIDWLDSDLETLEVEYQMPRQDPKASPDRKYFGYIVHLYYKSVLQDDRGEPSRLSAQFPAPATPEKNPE